VLDAAIELPGQYQRQFQVRAIHLNLSAQGDIDVSIVQSMDNGATELPYGRIDGVTGKFTRRETLCSPEGLDVGARSKASRGTIPSLRPIAMASES